MPSPLDYISYLIAYAAITPVALWLRAQDLFGFGDWVMSGLYAIEAALR